MDEEDIADDEDREGDEGFSPEVGWVGGLA